jgi:hypothetical protein
MRPGTNWADTVALDSHERVAQSLARHQLKPAINAGFSCRFN